MNRRTNLLWLAGGILIGSLGLVVIPSVITMGGAAGYARTAGPQRQNIMRVLAAHHVAAASQESGGDPQKPNILFIMGDDIGWMQPSIYHRRTCPAAHLRPCLSPRARPPLGVN
jgi:hypothetical protein